MMVCDKSFSGLGLSTSRAAAHILGRPVLGQLKAGILPYIMTDKKDDDRRGAFINAKKTICRIMREKEQCLEGKKRNK